jgi:hypothetical protein
MTTIERSTWTTKVGLARMLAGGVIMDVVTADQAKVAEEAGAVAVMALERVPSDIRKYGGEARMSDPRLITEIKEAVSIPVMAKCRIGHFAEAQVLEALGEELVAMRNAFLSQEIYGSFGRYALSQLERLEHNQRPGLESLRRDGNRVVGGKRRDDAIVLRGRHHVAPARADFQRHAFTGRSTGSPRGWRFDRCRSACSVRVWEALFVVAFSSRGSASGVFARSRAQGR